MWVRSCMECYDGNRNRRGHLVPLRCRLVYTSKNLNPSRSIVVDRQTRTFYRASHLFGYVCVNQFIRCERVRVRTCICVL